MLSGVTAATGVVWVLWGIEKVVAKGGGAS